MSLLWFIWLTTIGLMSFAVATMAALIAARLVREHHRARRAARRAIVLPEIVNHIGGLSTEPFTLFGLEADADLMAGIVRDLAGLVRGGERTRLMQALQVYDVDAALRALLGAGSNNQRVVAAEALAFFPDEQSRSALHAACRHRSVRVRLAALRSLIEIGAPPPLAELLDSVITGPNRASLLFSDVLQQAVRTQIDDAMIALSRADLPRTVRIMLLQALGAARDARALKTLQDAARDSDGEIRAGALAALAALGHPGARDSVAAGLDDADWRVRLRAIECARKLGLAEFVPQLQAHANDPSWWVRHRAGGALIAIAEQDVVKLRAIVARAADTGASGAGGRQMGAPSVDPRPPQKKRAAAKPRLQAVKSSKTQSARAKRAGAKQAPAIAAAPKSTRETRVKSTKVTSGEIKRLKAVRVTAKKAKPPEAKSTKTKPATAKPAKTHAPETRVAAKSPPGAELTRPARRAKRAPARAEQPASPKPARKAVAKAKPVSVTRLKPPRATRSASR